MRLSSNWRRAAFVLSIFVATSGLLAACGGGGDGNDEDYVTAICESRTILDDVFDIIFTAAFSDEEPDQETLDKLVEGFEKWIDALDDANPPPDAADAHDAAIDSMRELIDSLKRGDEGIKSLFDDDDSATLDPPQAVKNRLRNVAAGVEADDDADLFG